MRSSPIIAGLLLSLAGSAEANGGGPLPIIGGNVVYTDPAVVGLATERGMVYCTGTLVSPRVVLTAGHCVHNIAAPGRIFLGTDPGADGMFLPVELAVAHPDYGRMGHAADIGLVVLARPVTIAPVPLQDGRLADDNADRDIRLVGFGTTETRGDGTGVVGVKYSRSVPITGLDERWLSYGVGACHGDSGGPTLVADAAGVEHLAGVISHGDSACVITGYSTRTDLYRTWIDAWITNVDRPTCSLDTRCVEDCTSPDPDCVIGDEMIAPEGVGCSIGSKGGLALGILALGLVLGRRRS